jgi:Zn-dependent peptidase ImmA (M78 family)
MRSTNIRKAAQSLVRRFETRDPVKIAKGLGIHVSYNYDFNLLKGMYFVIDRSRFIIINGNLNDRDKKVICAHELGHDALHRHLAKEKPLKEFMLYDMKSRAEYEANIFAGELLIDDSEIMELIEEGYDNVAIAGELDTDINLVLIKADELRKRGYDIRVSHRPGSDFLGRS